MHKFIIHENICAWNTFMLFSFPGDLVASYKPSSNSIRLTFRQQPHLYKLTPLQYLFTDLVPM